AGSVPASCTSGTVLLTGSGTSFTHTGLTNGTTYGYRVCATDAVGNASSGVTASATPQAGPPSGGGEVLWVQAFNGTSIKTVQAVAVDRSPAGNGNLVVVGSFRGTVDFGTDSLTSAGSGDIYIVKYAAAGTPVWAKRLGANLDDAANTVAIDSAGDIVVAGTSTGTVDVGGGPLTSASTTATDIFLAKYTAAGAHVWSKRIGGTSWDQAPVVAIDASRNVVLTGSFFGTVNFGGTALVSAGSSDVFLAKYAGADGAHLWSKRIGGAGVDQPYALALDGTGDLVVVGSFAGSVDFGGGLVTYEGGRDLFVAKYAGTTGAHVWSRRAGYVNWDEASGV